MTESTCNSMPAVGSYGSCPVSAVPCSSLQALYPCVGFFSAFSGKGWDANLWQADFHVLAAFSSGTDSTGISGHREGEKCPGSSLKINLGRTF